MAYTKHEFKSGEKLYASQLNEMDEQIAKNEEAVEEIKGKAARLVENENGDYTLVL